MTERIVIIDQDLQGAIHNLTLCAALLTGTQVFSDAAAGAVGHGGLADAIKDVSSQWDVRRKRLSEATDTILQQLRTTKEAFEAADHGIADSLRNPKESPARTASHALAADLTSITPRIPAITPTHSDPRHANVMRVEAPGPHPTIPMIEQALGGRVQDNPAVDQLLDRVGSAALIDHHEVSGGLTAPSGAALEGALAVAGGGLLAPLLMSATGRTQTHRAPSQPPQAPETPQQAAARRLRGESHPDTAPTPARHRMSPAEAARRLAIPTMHQTEER